MVTHSFYYEEPCGFYILINKSKILIDFILQSSAILKEKSSSYDIECLVYMRHVVKTIKQENY